MRKLMKQTLVAAAMALGISGMALADDHAKGCTPATLHGLYIFAATGYTIPPDPAPAQPKAILEFIRFNGDGTLSVPGATRSVNGVIAQIPPGGTGTYTVSSPVANDPACIGSLTFGEGRSFDLFIAPKGDDIWMIQTNPNNVFQGTVTKVSH